MVHIIRCLIGTAPAGYDAISGIRAAMQSTGQGDLEQGANYQFFEQIAPRSQVVAELDQAKPGWRKDHEVNFYGNPQ